VGKPSETGEFTNVEGDKDGFSEVDGNCETLGNTDGAAEKDGFADTEGICDGKTVCDGKKEKEGTRLGTTLRIWVGSLEGGFDFDDSGETVGIKS